MKIMLLVLHKCKRVMSRATSGSILLLNVFYPHGIQKNSEVKILQTKFCENLVDLFTKYLPMSSFQRYVRGIGMKQLEELQELGRESHES